MLHCSVCFVDGLPIDGDASQTMEVIAGLHSHNTFSTSIAKALVGMKPEEKRRIEVPPEDAFGKIDLKRVVKIKMNHADDFPVGEVVTIQTSQEPAGESSQTGLVVDNDGDFAHVDTNHPLAGETLLVNIRILKIT